MKDEILIGNMGGIIQAELKCFVSVAIDGDGAEFGIGAQTQVIYGCGFRVRAASCFCRLLEREGHVDKLEAMEIDPL